MRLTSLFVVVAASNGEERKETTRPKRQLSRFRPRTFNYNYNMYNSNPRYSSRNRGVSQSTYGRRRNNAARIDTYSYSYHNQYNQYQPPRYPVYPPIKPTPNQKERYKNGVPVAKPGHLARQAGRNVRPPGERDERELNPRNRAFETSLRHNNYGQNDDYSYDYSDIQYNYDDSDPSSETTMATPTAQPATTVELFQTVPSHAVNQSANFEYLDKQCGPHGLGTNHTECQLNRPWNPRNPDLSGFPDLITDATMVQRTVNLHFAFLKDMTCALEEGCFSPSAYSSVGGSGKQNLRKLLRFTQKISNIGDADFISPVNPQRWKYHSCHKHYHSMNVFAKYSLLSISRRDIMAASHKASFCLEDTECRAGTHKKYHCLKEQAISPGCSDVYISGVDCQWIDVTDVTPGRYVLQIQLNPARAVTESNFKNNILECDIFLTSREAKAKNCRNNS